MIRVNIHEVKVHLSRYLQRVARGEVVVICNRNVPVAELRAVRETRRKRRPIGLAKGEFTVTPAFFEPLPDDLLDAFDGRGR